MINFDGYRVYTFELIFAFRIFYSIFLLLQFIILRRNSDNFQRIWKHENK